VNLSLALLSRAARTPDAPAVESDECVWTFAELADRARRGAGYLLRHAEPGPAPIALLLPGDARFVAWFIAVALAGRAVLPLNTRLTAGELAQQLSDAQVTTLVCEAGESRADELLSLVPGLRALQAQELSILPATLDQLPGESVEVDSVLAVLFTSGTSGRAKGACLSWSVFEASAFAAAERLGPAVNRRWLACMPLFHVGGLSIVVRSLLFGGPIRLQPRFDAAAVSDALDAGGIAGVSLVPTMLSRLLDYRAERAAPPGLEVLLLGGAAAPPSLVERSLAAGYPVCPTYGLTEATSQVATARPPAPGSSAPSPMLALQGTDIRIVVADRVAAVGEAGEILVRGPTVMMGYLNDPAATARALHDRWLHTGDVGYLDAEGGLHVLDRREDLVVSGGENVYPAEVEAVLLEHPSVSEAGVTGVADVDLGARVVAWVVPSGGSVIDVAALAEHCRKRLAGFKRPREIRVVDSLPRTAAGKLQRRKLTDPASDS
jgi:O-succinylbenzoic acid--CoA ligase